MTQAELDLANNIQEQIASINKLLQALSFDYELNPPTRRTSWVLKRELTESKVAIELNEGEVVAFRDALESRKACLQREFDRL